MNVEKMERNLILANLKKLGLLTELNTPVLYSVFKNRASIMKFGKRGSRQLKIVFIGIPKEALFGFYVECDADPVCMKQAYDWYLKLVTCKIDFDDVDIHFGNCGFPIQYDYIRYLE
jgi:hypothetical protein